MYSVVLHSIYPLSDRKLPAAAAAREMIEPAAEIKDQLTLSSFFGSEWTGTGIQPEGQLGRTEERAAGESEDGNLFSKQ